MVDQRRIDNQPYVDARTASRFLGIQVRTLYAYVSRGLVRSMPGANGRPRLYAQADLERRGAPGAVDGLYRLDYTLTHAEVDA